jgi:hypothetical protein
MNGLSSAAMLIENSRPAKMPLGAGILEIVGDVNANAHWGWDGACLGNVSAFSQDPIGYKSGVNLCEYCGDDPTNRTDPSGNGFLDTLRNVLPIYLPLLDIDDLVPSLSDEDKSLCDFAQAMGLDEGAIGGVICYKGRKIACVWKDSAVDATNPTAVKICRRCTQLHEVAHFESNDCDCKRKTVYRPNVSPGFSIPLDECRAYSMEISCLTYSLEECNGDKFCIAQVEAERSQAEYMRRRFCDKVLWLA